MDAFYASVEQRNNPSLKGKPVIVGGNPKSRGVVAACSYEARKFGIHSAMASSIAYRLCPNAIFIRGHFDEYHAVSEQIHEIFHDYTDMVEPLSLDEAYLDVTENKAGHHYATSIAREIRKKIYERTGLTASAGVSYCKFLAKVASDYHKPDGLTVIIPEEANAFIEDLPIGKFFGIGKVTERKMLQLGIHTGRDLKRLNMSDLTRLFGKIGEYYYDIAHGIDDRPVETDYIRKSIGKEETFERDLDDINEMHGILKSLSWKVAESLVHHETRGRTVTLKVKYADFTCVSRSITTDEPCYSSDIILMHAKNLLLKTAAGVQKVRLLGISISNLDIEKKEVNERQLMLPFAM